MYQPFGIASLNSFWYWVLCILTWSLVCNRTLGVPHDMVRRARRVPEVAEKVDTLAMIFSERIAGFYDRAGALVAALCGFGLAALGVVAFASGIELAKAAFLLAFPLAMVGYSNLRLALAVRRWRLHGPGLRRSLTIRRILHTLIAVSALMLTASLAVVEHPILILR